MDERLVHQTIQPELYKRFLSEVLARVGAARTSAAKGVTRTVIALYGEIGAMIVQNQERHGWGEAVVERLSGDLTRATDGREGFSRQNLWLMRQFYLEYRDKPELRRLALEIPWGHNLLLLQKVKPMDARRYYLQATAKFGWSRNVLLNQIKARSHSRAQAEKKTHNFPLVLPEHLAEQADEALKSSYNLEFLGLKQAVRERELEDRLVDRLKQFILELGYGFCFIGRQYRVNVNGKDYFIDLLFYHRFLKALVAVELKVGAFEPEFAGKMDFYLNLLNQKERAPGDNSSIGIILCAEKDDVVVEFSLKSKTNPIGVAEYQLTEKLPRELKGKLPTEGELRTALLFEKKTRD